MNQTSVVLRYAAFTATPDGGNPAGVVLDATHLNDSQMQVIAADVGYAETVFVTEAAVDGDTRRNRVRYFSPIAEVPFCGHATIALAVALSRLHGTGTFMFDTPVGPVAIESGGQGSALTASFTSVEPRVAEFPAGVLDTLLGLLGVGRDELDGAYPPMVAFAGNWHPVLVFADRRTFDSFVFDPDRMRVLGRGGSV
jgi:PhzF family phenazine biosynthesis protein